MKRFLAGFLAVAMGVVCTLALPNSVAAQFPFPVAHYSVVDDAGTGSDAGCCATQFDGSSDYLSHTDATGWADSNKFTFSFWVKRDRNGVTERILDVSDSSANGIVRFAISFLSTDLINVIARGSSGISTFICDFSGSTAITDTDWHHVLISVDLSSTSNRHMYVDDVAETLSVATYNTLGEIDFTGTDYRVAFFPTVPFDGALSELWFDPGTYFALGTESNRRKFITSGALPEDLGSDGSTPTGSAPKMYLSDASGTNTGTTTNYAQTGSPTSVDGPNP